VGTGKDYTLFALKDGYVVFERKRDQKRVSVYSEVPQAS
jgi:ribosomal protein L27